MGSQAMQPGEGFARLTAVGGEGGSERLPFSMAFLLHSQGPATLLAGKLATLQGTGRTQGARQ